LYEVDRLVQIQLVSVNCRRELRIAEDAHERVSKVFTEALDGFIIERRIISFLIGIRVCLPAGWIFRILASFRHDLLLLVISSETERSNGSSSSSSSSSRHG
jgi:hypothetical protein